MYRQRADTGGQCKDEDLWHAEQRPRLIMGLLRLRELGC